MAAGHARVTDRRPAPGVTDKAAPDTPEETELEEGWGEAEEPESDDFDPQAAGLVATIRHGWRRGAGTVEPPPRWRPWVAWVLSLMGVGVSTYLTIAHYSSSSILACADQGLVDCAKVTTSAQSEVFGVLPVAVLGLAFYLVMAVVTLPLLWRVQDRRVHLVRLALSVVGMGFVLYLLAAELVVIGNICLWCTSVHIITFLVFLVTLSTIPAMLGWGRGSSQEAD